MGNRVHMKVRFSGLGPGGWHCPCCAPKKPKRAQWVRAKKRAERHVSKLEMARDAAGV